MLKIAVLSIFCFSLLFALSDENKDPNTKYYETLNKNRSYYKAHRQRDKALKNLKDTQRKTNEKGRKLFQKYSTFEDIEIKKELNRAYYKTLIKQRSKLKPDEYKYIKVKNREDLKKAGFTIKKGDKKRKVINYVEIKNFYQSPFKKNKTKNIGVLVNKKAKSPKKILNIVDIENSSINAKLNSGVSIEKSTFKGEIKNSVELRNSKIGDLE